MLKLVASLFTLALALTLKGHFEGGSNLGLVALIVDVGVILHRWGGLWGELGQATDENPFWLILGAGVDLERPVTRQGGIKVIGRWCLCNSHLFAPSLG